MNLRLCNKVWEVCKNNQWDILIKYIQDLIDLDLIDYVLNIWLGYPTDYFESFVCYYISWQTKFSK